MSRDERYFSAYPRIKPNTRIIRSYKQALHAAIEGRKRTDALNVPFTRPTDFFAEMVKTDEHMERVRQKLLDERAGIRASEEAKKQRELKKFGKKVQVEKLLERQKRKKDMADKVKGLRQRKFHIRFCSERFADHQRTHRRRRRGRQRLRCAPTRSAWRG